MFGNNYSNPYGFNSMPTATQPYGYPMNPYPAPQPMTQQTNTNKIYVTGIEDVRNRALPTGSDYVFLDNDKPLLYQKIVDSKGQFDVKIFDITPHVEQPTTEASKDYVPIATFEALQKKVATLEDTLTLLVPIKAETQEGQPNGTNS